MHKFNTKVNKGADHTHVRLDRISAVKPDHEHASLLVDGMWIDVFESEEEVLALLALDSPAPILIDTAGPVDTHPVTKPTERTSTASVVRKPHVEAPTTSKASTKKPRRKLLGKK